MKINELIKEIKISQIRQIHHIIEDLKIGRRMCDNIEVKDPYFVTLWSYEHPSRYPIYERTLCESCVETVKERGRNVFSSLLPQIGKY